FAICHECENPMARTDRRCCRTLMCSPPFCPSSGRRLIASNGLDSFERNSLPSFCRAPYLIRRQWFQLAPIPPDECRPTGFEQCVVAVPHPLLAAHVDSAECRISDDGEIIGSPN